MKKKILLITGLFFSAVSFAQHITYGGGAGVAIYNMRGEAVTNLKQTLDFTNGIVSASPVTGFYVGAYTNIPVGNNLSVEPGLYFTQKGYQVTGSYTVKDIALLSANASAALKTSYIDLPVLLKADFNGFQVFAGPQLSYLTTASLNTKAAVGGFNMVNNSADATARLNRWGTAVTAGIGYRFTNGISLNASYERGLSKVDAGKNMESYNQGIKIGAAFSF